MTRLLAWLASFREAFRLARQIQAGVLVAVPPETLRQPLPIPDAEPVPPRLIGRTSDFESEGAGSTPAAAIEHPNGRYEVRTVRGDQYHSKLRTDDLAQAKQAFYGNYTVPVELYDHRLNLVRGRR